MAKRHPGQAAKHLYAYGSSRYTSQGAKNPSRIKGAASFGVGAVAGSVVGQGIGYAAGKGQGAYAGANIGSAAGAVAGRAYARKKGFVQRTKPRMSVRAIHKVQTQVQQKHHSRVGSKGY